MRPGGRGGLVLSLGLVGLLGLLGLGGCARLQALPAPKEPVAASLFRDLERQVTVAAAAGWGIDRMEIEELLAPALDSVCRVSELDRRALRGVLDENIAAAGGSVEEVWRQRGKELSKVENLLVLTRMRMLLQRADEVAGADCPFWLEPDAEFRGRQISRGRWQLTGGGGGKGIVVRNGGETDFLFGGAGRILFGRVDQKNRGVYLGAELGASASFPKDDMGDRSRLILAADLVVPVMVRFTGVNSYLELEAGWLGRSTEEDFTDVDHGVHLGVSVGGRALRTRFFFPGAAFGVSVARTFVVGDDPLMLKLGVRIAFDVDL